MRSSAAHAVGRPKRRRRSFAFTTAVMFAMSVLLVGPSVAGHAGLSGSAFESEDGNLKINDPVNHIDWETVAVASNTDLPTGSNDNSFGQGASEDTACPAVVSGSIPPNKSDLKTFGLYVEDGSFLHMFWTRVQDPKGTTNMDFEFNQNDPVEDPCSNGVTPVRAAGDALITYNLSKGGTVPSFFVHRWLTSGANAKAECESNSSFPCWSDGVELSASGDATGSVNTTAIPSGDFGGRLDAFTFGEGSIDLSAVFPPGEECINFGSAYLKSRSSDSFTSALKDFIAPLDFELSNCGSLTVKKETVPAGVDDTFDFTLENTDITTENFTLGDGDTEKFQELFGGTYTITEADPGPEFALIDITCTGTDAENIDVDLTNGTVDVTLAAEDIVTCTFTNERQLGSILVVKHDDSGELLAGAGFTITPGDIVMTEYANGVFCTDDLDFDDYTVTETTVPPGYNQADPDDVTVDETSTCDDRVDTDGLPVGDVDSTFVNNSEPGTVNILKEDDAGNPLDGIGFTLYVDDNEDDTHQETETTVAKAEQFTDANGTTTFTDVPLGFYCAVETTPSADHDAAAPQCFEIGLGDAEGEGQEINLTFENPRKHRIVVLVCHEGTDTLHQSDVELGTETKQSLDGSGLTAAQQKELCDLGGASFGGISGHDAKQLDVTPDAH